jgi:ketosteroid isomerase-like protein
MSRIGAALAGAAVALMGRAMFPRLLMLKFSRDVRRLNAGEYHGLLRSYSDDAVLLFNEGPHRWSGEHRGKAAIERFFRDFTSAGLQGELSALWVSGAPWALTLVGRFDDEARGPDGERIYANRVVMVLRTRWGKIVEQEDFYVDTGRIAQLEERLTEMGVSPAGLVAVA